MNLTQHLKNVEKHAVAASAIVNGTITQGVLALDTVSETGSIPILYTGDTTTPPFVTTPMQVANDNGDGVTLAADWAYVSAGDYAIAEVVIDNSATGDALAYKNLTGVNTTTSPLLDPTNWKREINQYGYDVTFKGRSGATSNLRFDSVRADCIEPRYTVE